MTKLNLLEIFKTEMVLSTIHKSLQGHSNHLAHVPLNKNLVKFNLNYDLFRNSTPFLDR